ncbi:TKL/TKL-ccin protein kinase [Coprinopsis sp. MPI-PUGE-AT-0042]|nr:TKL/TKL-ccin protein kinase [Coprinopsis sp. MPI-PUGE-AT-0042]
MPATPPLAPSQLRTTSNDSDLTLRANGTAEDSKSAVSSPASSDDGFPQFNAYRPRGQAPSSMQLSSPSITIDAAAADFRRSQSDSASVGLVANSQSLAVSRGRSLSPSKNKSRAPSASPSPSGGLDASWWNLAETGKQPWKEQPKRKHTTPASHLEGYQHTKQRVALAVRSCLGNVADVGHELLSIGVELLELAPVPGLAPAAKTLLNIWDAAEMVDVNQYGCIRLAERCADLLISIREEVHEAGDTVAQELQAPISKLEATFFHILEFMRKQVRRPFLKRFLKREEILNEMNECDAQLRDALSLFGLSVQIRILKQVQAIEHQRQKDTQEILNTVITTGMANASKRDSRFPPISHSPEDQSQETTPREEVTHFITTSNALGLSEPFDPSNLHSGNVLPVLKNLQQSQNSLDFANDVTALRQLMHQAIQASSDAEVVEMLQVNRHQMPDAIKSLQRALDHSGGTERRQSQIDSIPPGVVVGKVKRRFSLKRGTSDNGIQRSKTVVSIESTSSSNTESRGSGKSSSRRTRDTLEQEFIESGISALVRMSQGQNTNLPSWTITKFEINREKRIGMGGFSDVYRGTWKGRTVAIKVLKLETDKKRFIREVEIWKTLHHPHVLELCGASSAIDPPWFLVSPYQKHGSLVDYLKKVTRDLEDTAISSGASIRTFGPDRTPRKTPTVPLPLRSKSALGITPVREASLGLGSPQSSRSSFEVVRVAREWDLLRFMHEIAKGMEYLHSRDVLHGDMKAANVLVDDNYRCVITDFGQSEMKSTAFRLTGRQPTRGTLRWQAPELLEGATELTREVDVYAFAIACVEIINMGRLPWGTFLEDEIIRNMVLKENSRPVLDEDSRFNTPAVQEILRQCWHRDRLQRPPFSKIARDFKLLRKNFEHDDGDTPQGTLAPLPEEDIPSSPSPDMKPGPLPPLAAPIPANDIMQWRSSVREKTVATGTIKMPEAVFFTPAQSPARDDDDNASDDLELIDLDFYPEAAHVDAKIAAVWDERRYRLLMTHEFHESLVVPLWHPSSVSLGAVGYLSKPRGEFITLFNALSPQASDHPLAKGLPSIHGYGKVEEGMQGLDKRSITQKGWDSIVGLLSRKQDHKNGDTPIIRRYTFPLRAGHVSAHLCTQTTEYRYMQKLTAAKKWFTANIENIMKAYPSIQREDLCLVVGLLRTPNYGLFVSHSHPDGHVHFNVYKSAKNGQPWGTFTTDTNSGNASKVSNQGGPWDTVLISRLRFRADEVEPTWRL